MENELQQKRLLIYLLLFIILIIIVITVICVYYLVTLNNKYVRCDANEKNQATVITTLDSRLKRCKENMEYEQKMCKEDILDIKTQRDELSTELEKVRYNSVNCDAQLEYCRLHYRNCKDQLQKEETKRENLEKTFNNATLECSKAQKICEIDIRSIKNELDDCEIQAKGKTKCQEELHKCNSKTCYII